MHLKRLELFGFKSFADRTVLEFQHGLTGIVGPNGCGKSNVVDAVRWVLGEQRPTSMRGTEMVDVIFKGSSARPALSVAEVSLVLDNTEGLLEGRGAEVSITRRVFRGGEGEYLLDGERVRLKDVRAMLYNTGLGSRGYSVLEQGKIDAVLSADPLERRGIFEEAAGVSRYRAQRKEVAARLQRVEQDMARLEDLIGELESRVRSLKIQAGKAERWGEARTAWRGSAESLARHQVWLCNQELSRVAAELTQRLAGEQELRGLRQGSEQDYGLRERESLTLQAEIERCSSEASELAAELRALDERRTNLASRAAGARAAAGEELARATALSAKLGEREAEAAQARGEHVALDEQARRAQQEAARLAEELRELGRRSKLARDSSQQANESVLACLRERTAAQNGLEHLAASLAPLEERAQQ
ncbi:MAG: chromosome segregation protein SMC, partial [Planctomycetes bacterium]|nr:chromosome segregation protein SMC [Planctomycetota bacterium]